MAFSENFYVVKYRDSDCDTYSAYTCPEDEEPIEWACYKAAKVICFSDCSDEQIIFICVGGREIEYAGWKPGMVYEFRDAATKEIVWSRQFRNWDH